MGMKPILKFLREMPDFQLCHRTLLSIYLDSIAVSFFSHLWESTQKGQPVSSNLLEPLMLKGYWIGLGRACDSKAGPHLAYQCPRAAPHLEVVWDPCALPLGAFSVAPILVSEQFPHHLPTAGAGGLTEFQGAALGDLLCQLTFKMLKYVCFGGHSGGPILRTTSHHHPLSHRLIHSVIISGKYFVQLFPVDMPTWISINCGRSGDFFNSLHLNSHGHEDK